MTWFADALLDALASVPGSPEREQVIALLRRARRIRLGDDVTRAVAETVRHACDTVEQHIDRIFLRDAATWIEYPHAPRSEAFAGIPVLSPETGGEIAKGEAPETVGCLIVCNPYEDSRVVVFVAWRFASGAIHHSYALLHWDRTAFIKIAEEALKGKSTSKVSAERLMEVSHTVVPPGFRAELEIWQDHKAANDPRLDAALLQTQRDASGEHLFLLTALLLIESSAVNMEEVREDRIPDTGQVIDVETEDGETFKEVASEAESEAATRFEARLVASRRWPWQSGGFRAPRFGGLLAWSEPRKDCA